MSTRTVTIHEAETNMLELIEWVSQGDEVLITKGNEPLAKVTAPPQVKGKRNFGQFAGKIWISDDFDASLSDDFWLGSENI